MSTDHRKQISFDAETLALVEASPNASAYVRDAVRRTHDADITEHTAYQLAQLASLQCDDALGAALTILREALGDAAQAWAMLRAQGWTATEVLAVMDALRGSLMVPGCPLSTSIALEMGDTDVSQWEVSKRRWHDLVALVREHDAVALALHKVARVFWSARGSAVEAALLREHQGDA